MRPLGEIYDREFFRQYGRANAGYVRACEVIATEIHRRFGPQSLVDWGCGAGLHAAALAKLGVKVTAVDAVRADDDLRAPIEVLVADLRAPITDAGFPERYDLSLCIDVMEHIDEADSAAALDNITRGAALLVLSCAPPGQRGHHHVNEQPRRYWVRRLAELDWAYDRPETGRMERVLSGRREELPWSWMYHNLCVYRRNG